MREVDVAIIGAGSAGLSARREVVKRTDNYVVIDDGELGTTCARVGCMPSKVIIQVAEDYHRRHVLESEGITGAETLGIDTVAAMRHTRSLRDRFVRSVKGGMESWSDHLIQKRARFADMNTLDLGDEKIRAKKIIIATGSTPVVPGPWREFSEFLVDTNQFFELKDLPKRMAVIGLGVIGLELGQALSRLGVEVTGITLDKRFGGLSDKTLQDYVHEKLNKEFPIHIDGVDTLAKVDEALEVTLRSGKTLQVDAALLAMGRKPNLSGLGMEALGIETHNGMPEFDSTTFRVKGTDWYIAGDVNGSRPLLHEASDEGRIVGFNATRDKDQCFSRRTPLTITFSSPPIGMVGESHQELVEREADFVVGSVSFEGQGRAIVKLKEVGLLHIYVSREDGKILGAELIAPNGDHLAQLLSWTVAAGLTVRDALALPFYHPVLEEGVRTALRQASEQLELPSSPLEVLRCEDPPVGVIA